MGWAVNKDCCGADFQASNSSFDKFLTSVGFIKQDGDYGFGESVWLDYFILLNTNQIL